MPATIEDLFRSESRRVLATLIRLLGDFDLAEEALQDAFAAAVERWQEDGVPANPRAWLVSTGRFKAIDGLRRRARFDASLASVAERLGDGVTPPHEVDDEAVEDDRLRLIFTCCHPALPPDAQIALTLREVCGLTTEEIARAFLSPAPTWRSGSSGPRPRSKPRVSPIRSPRAATSRSGSRRCSTSSTCRRLGRTDEAIDSYQRALDLTRQEPQRRFLERRLLELRAQ